MSNKKRGLTDNPLFTKTEQEKPAMLPTPSAEATVEYVEPQPAHAPKAEETNDVTSLPDSLTNPSVGPLTGQSTDQSPNQSTGQSTTLSITQSTGQPPLVLSMRQILNRPASFYLYEDQIEDLDNLANLLKKEYKFKTDRSALLRAILSKPILDYHQRETHHELINRLIQQLAGRLISQ